MNQNNEKGTIKRRFEIEYPDDLSPLWMNRDNLMLCLQRTCKYTAFTVTDITGDGCDPTPASCDPARSQILGALARGYCTKENADKVLDSTLLEACAVELLKLPFFK